MPESIFPPPEEGGMDSRGLWEEHFVQLSMMMASAYVRVVAKLLSTRIRECGILLCELIR